MSIAMLSAFSLICADVAMAARPLPVAAIAAQSAVSAVDTEIEAPATEEIAESPIKASPDSIISDEEFSVEDLAFAGEDDATVAKRLETYLRSIDTLKGDFTQIAPSGAVSTGRFFLRRPGLLRFEYDPPTPLLIVANGGIVYVRDEALETTDSYPAGKTPLKFLLRRDIDLEKDAHVVAVDRGVDTVAVTLASNDDETEGELTIIVSAPEMSLKRWIVRDIQNGSTVVALDNVERDTRLANRLFETPDAGGRFLKD